MKTFKSLAVMILLSSFLASSCSKYDEGGKREEAKQNLTTEWSMEKGFKNGVEKDSIQENPQIGEVFEDWKFRKDGSLFTEDGNITMSGQWSLLKDNKQIEIAIDSPSSKVSTYTYQILKLTSGSDGEMVWEHDLNGNHYRYEFVSSR